MSDLSLAMLTVFAFGLAVGAWSAKYSNRRKAERDKRGRLLIDVEADSAQAMRVLRAFADAMEDTHEVQRHD